MLYPIMTTSRELVDLNGIWNFQLDSGTGFEEQWFGRPLQQAIPMPVPASFNDLYEGAEFRDHIGWVWYEREIVVPEHFFTQRIVLRFGSVTHAARVYLNGQLVVEHTGGFTPFEAEINTFASSGKNRLTVAVNTIVDHTTLPVGNYQEEDVPGLGKVVTDTPNFDFFNYAGSRGTPICIAVSSNCGRMGSVWIRMRNRLVCGRSRSGTGNSSLMGSRSTLWIGANSFRTSHYPYSEELMRLADREVPAVGLHLNFGFFGGGGRAHKTWEELGTKEHHAQVIRELIARDKNHPCVVMWSIANESASEEEGAHDYFQPLVQLARDLDPQKRPVTIVIHMMATPDTNTVSDLVDVLALNLYYGWYAYGGQLEVAKANLRAELTRWNQVQPGKPMMFTEYGADTIAGFHDTTPVMFSEEYQVACLQANHEVIDGFPTFIGEQVWHFTDFQTSQGIMRVQGNKKGVFTRERKPKMAAHYLRERWMAIPDFGYKS